MKKSLLLRNRWHFVLLFLLTSFVGFSQQTVTGTVRDANDKSPLVGVSVVVQGTTQGAITQTDGSYSLTVTNPNSVLVFSFIGFASQEIPVGSQSQINVSLAANDNVLSQVVVVGYGTQKKKEVTGAVSVVKAESIEKSVVSDLGEAIQGQVAGVNVQSASGRPGEAANIQIRGVGSLLGTLEPLYIVDGVPYESNPNIAPEQIESLDILKDGASASIYGTRASNGVILITTKRGKKGKIDVTANAYTGVQNITSGTPLMNTQQQLYADYTRTAQLTGATPILFNTNPTLLDYNTNFVGDVQRNNAAMSNYSLGVSGGNDLVRLNLATNYFNQTGVLINSGFDRLSTRLTTEFTKGKFKAFSSIGMTNENRTQEPWSLYEYAIGQRPWQIPLNGVPETGENMVTIPVDNAIYYGYLSRELKNVDERKVKSNNIALNLEYEILRGLSYKINVGKNTYDYSRSFFRPQSLINNRDGSFNPTASREKALLNEDFTFSERSTIENILNFNKDFGKHSLNLTGVISYEKFSSKQLSTGVIGLLSNATPTLGAGEAGTKPSGFNYNTALAGKLVRAQYSYGGRYLLSASFRRDGSSNFGESNRYGNFYGVSAGWNVSDENFFKKLNANNNISSLKFRASTAGVGNQSIPPYTASSQIESGVNYIFGTSETFTTGAIQRRFSNPNVKWESSISNNIGLDLAMFNNKLTFTLDLYKNDKKNMLLGQQTPPSAGANVPGAIELFSNIIVNAGNMTNKGIELALGYQSRTKYDLKWNVAGTFSKNINTVTNLNGIKRGYSNGRPTQSLGTAVDFTTFFAEGYEAGAFFLVKNAGVIKTQADLDVYKKIDASAKLGDMRYIDQDGNNKIDDNDRVYAGSGQAKFNLGFNLGLNYKGFDLFVQNYFSYGAQIYNGARFFAYAQGRHVDQFSMWSPQNPTSDIPADRSNAYHNNVRARSDFFLEDGTYFRIRNITLGYNIATPSMKKLGINAIRPYFSSLNPFTFTKYTGYDPEVGGNGITTRGVDSGNYPVARRFTVGIQFKL